MSWNGILKIFDIKHFDSAGNLLWGNKNILNFLHQDGEEYLLRAAFTGGRVSTIIPDSYWLGLDNRSSPQVADQLSELVGEPTTSGYERQGVSSSGDFAINFEQSHYVATSPIVAFRATVGTWGPVSNLFLTDSEDNSGYLISTAALGTSIIIEPGDSVTMRIGMQLRDCPDNTCEEEASLLDGVGTRFRVGDADGDGTGGDIIGIDGIPGGGPYVLGTGDGTSDGTSNFTV